LLGQNGAGKSTLIKILAGVHAAQSGRIEIDGTMVDPMAGGLPINFIHQDLGLIDSMTVAENVAIAAGYRRRRGRLIDWRATARAAHEALSVMASDIDPARPVSGLTAAEKSIVAIARALATRCDILVLDEPTASLPEADVGRLFEALDRLRAKGLGIIYVSHRLDEVFRLADRVTVLRDGRRIATCAVSETTGDALVTMIVGRKLLKTTITDLPPGGAPLLELRDLCTGGTGPVSLSLRPGETLGLVGLRGAGHHAIARAIFGDRPITGGEIRLHGKPVAPKDPEQAMAAGIGFIPSKRAEEAMAAGLSVQENLFLNPGLTGTGPATRLDPGEERARADQVVARYSVRPADPARPIATLSGGNQQKVIVARWLEGGVDLLILEEPTIGVDVGSKAEIYALMQGSLAHGMAVLLVSSDFEEVAQMCHRALVFSRGAVVAEIPREELTVAQLTARAACAEEKEGAE
jgi:ribose transport system ATP-binding protein